MFAPRRNQAPVGDERQRAKNVTTRSNQQFKSYVSRISCPVRQRFYQNMEEEFRKDLPKKSKPPAKGVKGRHSSASVSPVQLEFQELCERCQARVCQETAQPEPPRHFSEPPHHFARREVNRQSERKKVQDTINKNTDLFTGRYKRSSADTTFREREERKLEMEKQKRMRIKNAALVSKRYTNAVNRGRFPMTRSFDVSKQGNCMRNDIQASEKVARTGSEPVVVSQGAQTSVYYPARTPAPLRDRPWARRAQPRLPRQQSVPEKKLQPLSRIPLIYKEKSERFPVKDQTSSVNIGRDVPKFPTRRQPALNTVGNAPVKRKSMNTPVKGIGKFKSTKSAVEDPAQVTKPKRDEKTEKFDYIIIKPPENRGHKILSISEVYHVDVKPQYLRTLDFIRNGKTTMTTDPLLKIIDDVESKLCVHPRQNKLSTSRAQLHKLAKLERNAPKPPPQLKLANYFRIRTASPTPSRSVISSSEAKPPNRAGRPQTAGNRDKHKSRTGRGAGRPSEQLSSPQKPKSLPTKPTAARRPPAAPRRASLARQSRLHMSVTSSRVTQKATRQASNITQTIKKPVSKSPGITRLVPAPRSNLRRNQSTPLTKQISVHNRISADNRKSAENRRVVKRISLDLRKSIDNRSSVETNLTVDNRTFSVTNTEALSDIGKSDGSTETLAPKSLNCKTIDLKSITDKDNDSTPSSGIESLSPNTTPSQMSRQSVCVSELKVRSER